MSEIGGEAVADIDAGCGNAAAQEGFAGVEARLGEEMGMVFGGLCGGETLSSQHGCELCRCTAEMAGDVEGVACGCTGTAQGVAFGCVADKDDVGEDEGISSAGGFGGIAAGERDAVQLAKRAEACKEAGDPGAACGLGEHGCGKSEREEGCEGSRAHGGEVAEATGEATMAYRFGRMEIAAEVAAFESEVSRDEDFRGGRRMEDGAVVADAKGDVFLMGLEIVADLLDERELAGEFRIFLHAKVEDTFDSVMKLLGELHP